MQKYKAIISDIDGTLAPLARHPKPNNKVISAIIGLKEKDIIFSLATGKPFSMIQHLIDDLKLDSPIIVDNGAAIFNAETRQPLWQSVMEKEKVDKILTIAKPYKKRMRLSNGREGFDVTDIPKNDLHAVKFYIMGFPVVEAEKFIKQIEDSFKNVAAMRTSAYEGDGYSDVYVTNADATKQHAVLQVTKILKISKEEIIGIGDEYNDFPLLMACGLKVAMGNAVDDLKAIADYIAPSVNEDGIIDVIKKYIK